MNNPTSTNLKKPPRTKFSMSLTVTMETKRALSLIVRSASPSIRPFCAWSTRRRAEATSSTWAARYQAPSSAMSTFGSRSSPVRPKAVRAKEAAARL